MRIASLVAPLAGFFMVCSGCAAESAGADDGLGTVGQELGATQSVANPAGTYTASVTANGTGCPAGTWEPRISADGRTLTVRFRDYTAMVGPGSAFSIKDCTLGVSLTTRSGQSFAFSSLTSYGSAYMDATVSAKATTRHSVSGGSVAAPAKEMKVFGVEDRLVQYRVEETLAEHERVWSSCGTSSKIYVQTRLVLQNNPQKTGSGYAGELPDDAASPPVEVIIGLAQKPC